MMETISGFIGIKIKMNKVTGTAIPSRMFHWLKSGIQNNGV